MWEDDPIRESLSKGPRVRRERLVHTLRYSNKNKDELRLSPIHGPSPSEVISKSSKA